MSSIILGVIQLCILYVIVVLTISTCHFTNGAEHNIKAAEYVISGKPDSAEIEKAKGERCAIRGENTLYFLPKIIRPKP